MLSKQNLGMYLTLSTIRYILFYCMSNNSSIYIISFKKFFFNNFYILICKKLYKICKKPNKISILTEVPGGGYDINRKVEMYEKSDKK